jgi:hypothetical protein
MDGAGQDRLLGYPQFRRNELLAKVLNGGSTLQSTPMASINAVDHNPGIGLLPKGLCRPIIGANAP